MAPPTLVRAWTKSPRSQGFYISGLAATHVTSPAVLTQYDFAIIQLTPQQTSQSRIAVRRVMIQAIPSESGLLAHWGIISGDLSQTWLLPSPVPTIVTTEGPIPTTPLSEVLAGSQAPANLNQFSGVIDCFAEALSIPGSPNDEYEWGPDDIVSAPGNPLQLVVFAPIGPAFSEAGSQSYDVQITVATERHVQKLSTDPSRASVAPVPRSTS
jgi:hypothetical protein